MTTEQNKSPPAHTPLPWKADHLMITAGREMLAQLGISNNFQPPRPYECEANAAFIVRACNSHYDLLAACEEFVRKVDAGEARSQNSYGQMKAAIAKARGQ